MAPSVTGPLVRLTHRQIMWVYCGLMVGMLLAALDQTIVATALPAIVGELGGLSQISWVVSAYLLTSTASTPLYGKISDLYGRKPTFQASILIFMAGSVFAGLAQNMVELVAARAVQGLGAGGLMAMTQAIIADIVSPRDRGRYQGYIGMVFAFASITGPLAGGFFVDHLTWRWIFLINPPIGVAALVVTSVVLRVPPRRVSHAIDYLGAALLVAGVMLTLLVLEWGGTEYPWDSPTILGLSAVSGALLLTFLVYERRAREPILPLRLFTYPTFSLSCAVLFLAGFAVFGAIVFVPTLLQLVRHSTATHAGLLLLPLTLGQLTTSIASGRTISRTGHYKVFPVAGTAVMSVALVLVSRIGAQSSWAYASASLVLLGLGVGMVMQVLVLAVQNVVEYRDLGTATATVTFFRSMGGSVGVALLGAILNNRLAQELAQLLPGAEGARLAAGAIRGTPAAIYALPEPVRSDVITAFARSLHFVFLCIVPATLLGLALASRIKETPLRRWSEGVSGRADGADQPARSPAGVTVPRIGASQPNVAEASGGIADD